MKKIIILIFLVLLAGVTGCKQENDSLLESTNSAIDEFIDNYSHNYFTDLEKLDYYVVTAIKALENSGYDICLDDFLNKEDVKDFYQQYDYQSIGDIFKAIEICRAFDVEYENAVNALNNFQDIDIYNYTYGLIALRITDINKSLQNELISKIPIINEEDYRDADYAGLALMATDELNINRDDIYKLIFDNVSEDGIIAWDNPNSCSTANVILGLIALNNNPEKVGPNDENLINSLLKYYHEGAFKYILDGEVDLDYATPQAFAALVGYKIYREEGKAFNLFL